jgi:cytochrome c biogenesis protein CcdA
MLLMVFAFVAGAATALSPCVLPVLPGALAAGATGGRLRPLRVVAGLVVDDKSLGHSRPNGIASTTSSRFPRRAIMC